MVRQDLVPNIRLCAECWACKKPSAITELANVLGAVSKQIAIAVDNMIRLHLPAADQSTFAGRKKYLLENTNDYQVDGFFFNP